MERKDGDLLQQLEDIARNELSEKQFDLIQDQFIEIAEKEYKKLITNALAAQYRKEFEKIMDLDTNRRLRLSTFNIIEAIENWNKLPELLQEKYNEETREAMKLLSTIP